ncbi:hypothetical protein [Streptomyces sp. MP131-18]|uniref:hypothetical protein n=1 Tax=Streptomyces sp. MP131-18 TaxID=1857892 RepID=UPI00097C18B3|nr:hypothetical protein [Streptomyces sp. MP131-18]ONK13549.1 hypothetical protein STBA_43190 [Streptomyces sp. MP131-18]
MDMDAFVPKFIRTVVDVDMNKWLGTEIVNFPPDRVDRAGDLVVVGNKVVWLTPELGCEGGFRHLVPDGTYPVYAAGYLSGAYGDEPERYCVNVLFIPLVERARLTAPSWNWGYGGVSQELGEYACLMSWRASQVTREDPRNEAIARARNALLADQARTRNDNWANEIVDPKTGANVLAFPVQDDGSVCGFEARSTDGEILAVLLVNYPH